MRSWTLQEQVLGGSGELEVARRVHQQCRRTSSEPTCVPVSPLCGRRTCATLVARKRNDSFRKIHSAAGGRQRARSRASGCPRSASRQSRRPVPPRAALRPAAAHGRGRARALRRRRRAPGPRSRRRLGGLLPAARRPRLPQREGGDGATAPLESGRRGQDVPGPSTSHRLRL
jgi:hypothetical protein